MPVRSMPRCAPC